MAGSNRPLIVTGLGLYDFACAAAVALRSFSGAADITCTSAARLPGRLLSFSREQSPRKRILVIGIGLAADPALLDDALAELSACGASVEWHSTCPLPDILPPSVKERLKIFVSEDVPLHEAVGRHLGASFSFIKSISPRYEDLFHASQYAFRSYFDSKPYHSAIRHMASCDPEARWSAAERQLVDFYLLHGDRELNGKSKKIADLKSNICKVAPHERSRVLILGESGTGKETIALQIHQASPRKSEPFIAFNCASVSPELLESRFLGYEKGAFTGAAERKEGVFELANGGTLFLDEIGELPMAAQGVLLRILEEGRFFRMGGREEVSVDVRVVSATNRNLVKMVSEKEFREDLYYRLSVIELESPSLRERKEDIAAIADSKWTRLGHGRLNEKQISALMEYDWPGNVRELMNVLERAHVFGKNFASVVREEKEKMQNWRRETAALPENMEEAMALHAAEVFRRHGSRPGEAMKALGISANTLRKYLARAQAGRRS